MRSMKWHEMICFNVFLYCCFVVVVVVVFVRWICLSFEAYWFRINEGLKGAITLQQKRDSSHPRIKNPKKKQKQCLIFCKDNTASYEWFKALHSYRQYGLLLRYITLSEILLIIYLCHKLYCKWSLCKWSWSKHQHFPLPLTVYAAPLFTEL